LVKTVKFRRGPRRSSPNAFWQKRRNGT